MLIWTGIAEGFIDAGTDMRYVMDDYGNAVGVPFCAPLWFFQET